jgi:hypothetical protein
MPKLAGVCTYGSRIELGVKLNPSLFHGPWGSRIELGVKLNPSEPSSLRLGLPEGTRDARVAAQHENQQLPSPVELGAKVTNSLGAKVTN